jgi:hypothetical protein
MRRLKQHRIYQAEDRGIRPDPEREHNHRRRRERPRLHELPKRKSKVVKHYQSDAQGSDLDSRKRIRANTTQTH